MTGRAQITLQRGLSDSQRTAAARLYWQAFGAKLGRVLGPEPRALRYLQRVIRGDHAIAALHNGQLVGIAGFKSPKGGFAEGEGQDLRAIYGAFGGLWRHALLTMLSNDIDNKRFLVDGIAVTEAARGQGIGAALVQALCDEACARGYNAVRLEVVDSNPRARALYERLGFRAIRHQPMGVLRYVFGFDGATIMVRSLTAQP